MNIYYKLNEIKKLYKNNGNIIKYLKCIDNRSENNKTDILISYDFQAGTYIEKYEHSPVSCNKMSSIIGKIINNLGEYNSMLEVGVGEATTLVTLLNYLTHIPKNIYGFDISWSRIKYAKKFAQKHNRENINLFVGDLFCTPLKNNSIDIVYTNHSLEPNGGKEKEALEELYRITNKYLVLIEPLYELANEEAQTRMREHGYIRNLYSIAKNLGYNIIKYELLENSVNPLNPTGILLIEKNNTSDNFGYPLCCPLLKTDLVFDKDSYYSKESLLAYPIVGGIPCLMKENAILATKFCD